MDKYIVQTLAHGGWKFVFGFDSDDEAVAYAEELGRLGDKCRVVDEDGDIIHLTGF